MRTAIGVFVLVLFTSCSIADDASTPRDAAFDDASTTDGSESGSDATGGSSGSSGDTGTEDASDAGLDIDSGEPDPVCEALDEPTCKSTSGCIALKGQQSSTGKYGFAGCAHWCVGSAVPACAIAPDKSCWEFPDSCVPDGWTPIYFCSQCTPATDAAAD